MGIAMHNPELYNSSNAVQKKATLQLLKEYSHKIKWNKIEDTAIDIGCGDGSVSVLVKNFAPYGFKKFLACDISEKMIKFASNRYGDEDILFRVLDVGGDLPEDLQGAFNHVFSFYALHWVKNQEKAFRNIYNLLSESGDCFMTLIGSNTLYSIYNILAKYPKWKSWLKDVDVFISPYHDVEHPEKAIAEIMKKCGFKNVDVKYKTMTNFYNNIQSLKDMVQSVEPFNMPQDVFDQFIVDYIAVGQEIGQLHLNDDGETTSAYFDHSLLIISANK